MSTKWMRYKQVVFSFGLLIALVAVMGCNQKRVKAVTLMNEGLKAQEHGKRGLAVDYLKQAINKDPTYAKPAYYLGQIHHRGMNSVQEAIPYYRKAVNRAPGHSKYAYHLGTALLETQSPEQAIPYLKKAANGRMHFAKAWLRLGEGQENVGAFKSAVQSYMRAIRANPTLSMTEDDSGIAYHKLGQLYVRFGLYDEALEVYANGLELNPDSLMLLHGRGVAEMKMKDYDTAIETFRRVVEKDSTRISANFNLASALRQKGEVESAVKQLESFMSRADRAEHEARIRVARDLIDKWNKKAEN